MSFCSELKRRQKAEKKAQEKSEKEAKLAAAGQDPNAPKASKVNKPL